MNITTSEGLAQKGVAFSCFNKDVHFTFVASITARGIKRLCGKAIGADDVSLQEGAPLSVSLKIELRAKSPNK